MKPDDLEQLLGGYATGSLTPEERKSLFEAALRDQELYDALVREQALKEALDEPAVRRELIAELERLPPSWRERAAAWLAPRYPIGAAALAVSAAAVMTIAIVKYSGSPVSPEPVEIAELRRSAPAVMTEPPAPAPPTPEQSGRPVKMSMPVQPKVRPPVLLLDEAEQKARPPEPSGGAVGGVIGGIISSSPAATAPPPPPPAVAEAMAVEDRTMKTAALPAAPKRENSVQARELFHGAAPRPVEGAGVVGGFPAASAMRGRQKSAAAPAAAAPAILAQPLGLRYSLVRAGASARITVEANGDSVLYVFRPAETGGWAPVTPGGLSLKAHTAATVPEFAAAAQALMVLSRRPLAELAQTGPGLTAALDRLEGGIDPSRLLTQVAEGSTYVVAPLARTAEVLVVRAEVK